VLLVYLIYMAKLNRNLTSKYSYNRNFALQFIVDLVSLLVNSYHLIVP
jgi:hypothetical protein